MNEVTVKLSGLFVNIYNQYKGEGKTYIPHTTVAKIIMREVYIELQVNYINYRIGRKL